MMRIAVEIPSSAEVVALEACGCDTVGAVKQKLQGYVATRVEVTRPIRVRFRDTGVVREVRCFDRAVEVRRAAAKLLGRQPASLAVAALRHDLEDPAAEPAEVAARLGNDQRCTTPGGSYSELCEAFACRTGGLAAGAAELLKRLPLEAQLLTCSCREWSADASHFIEQLAATVGVTLDSPILGADVVVEIDQAQGKLVEPGLCSCSRCSKMNSDLLAKMVKGSRGRGGSVADSDEEDEEAAAQHVFTVLPSAHLEVRHERSRAPAGYFDKASGSILAWADYGSSWRLVRQAAGLPRHCSFMWMGRHLEHQRTLKSYGLGTNSTLQVVSVPKFLDPSRKSEVGSLMLAWLAGGA